MKLARKRHMRHMLYVTLSRDARSLAVIGVLTNLSGVTYFYYTYKNICTLGISGNGSLCILT